MKQPTIGIIGYGMVGSGVGAWFRSAKKYDPKKYPDGWSAVDRCEIVFICVPTPYQRSTGYQYRAIDTTARQLTGKKIVVVKSTVLPGKTAELQKRYPQHIWLFNPEFLRDKTAVKDFLQPDRQIVGMARNSSQHRTAAKRILQILPRAPFSAVTLAHEAEMIKIFSNAFGALKVVYANMVFDVCKMMKADYSVVQQGISRDVRITPSWMNVAYDGYRGYSGKCFPKDVGAIIAFGRRHRHRLRLLEVADELNWKLLPKQHRKR